MKDATTGALRHPILARTAVRHVGDSGIELLASRPRIIVPAVTLDGVSDTLKPGGTAGQAGMFTARHEHRVIHAGHNLPREAPAAFADAVLTVRKWLPAGDGN